VIEIITLETIQVFACRMEKRVVGKLASCARPRRWLLAGNREAHADQGNDASLAQW
jgi:hypothetical protein